MQELAAYPTAMSFNREDARSSGKISRELKREKKETIATYQYNLDYRYNEFFSIRDLLFHITPVLP